MSADMELSGASVHPSPVYWTDRGFFIRQLAFRNWTPYEPPALEGDRPLFGDDEAARETFARLSPQTQEEIRTRWLTDRDTLYGTSDGLTPPGTILATFSGGIDPADLSERDGLLFSLATGRVWWLYGEDKGPIVLQGKNRTEAWEPYIREVYPTRMNHARSRRRAAEDLTRLARAFSSTALWYVWERQVPNGKGARPERVEFSGTPIDVWIHERPGRCTIRITPKFLIDRQENQGKLLPFPSPVYALIRKAHPKHVPEARFLARLVCTRENDFPKEIGGYLSQCGYEDHYRADRPDEAFNALRRDVEKHTGPGRLFTRWTIQHSSKSRKPKGNLTWDEATPADILRIDRGPAARDAYTTFDPDALAKRAADAMGMPPEPTPESNLKQARKLKSDTKRDQELGQAIHDTGDHWYRPEDREDPEPPAADSQTAKADR